MAQPLRIIRAASKVDNILPRLAAEARGIRAFHGSPHSFDRFDASKIGTGEGAQAYGHGLYFAGAEDTARTYRDALSDGSLIVEGATSPLTERSMRDMGLGLGAIGYIRRAVNEGADPVSWLRQVQSLYPPLSGRWNEMSDAIEFLQSAKGPLKPHGGHVYEVELGVPEDSLLDYDKPFSNPVGVVGAEVLRQDNPVAVSADTLRAIQDGSWKWESFRGRSPYQTAAVELTRLARTRGGAQALREAGIPGIRYLDGNSRPASQGTRNYVMFPGTEDRIRILRKYGLLGPAAASLGGDDEQ
jgi:hypothetical protein